MVKSSSAVLAASLLAGNAMAWANEPVCKVVTVTETGSPVWVPVATGWEDWDTTTTTAPPAIKTTTVYTEHWDDWTKTIPEAITVTTYTTIPVVPTTTTVAPPAPTHTGSWGNSTISTGAGSSTSAAPSSTTSAAPAAATCPASNGQTVEGFGSCGCEFAVHCGVHAVPDANSKFWEQDGSVPVTSLADCLALCDSNDKCEAALWVDDATSGDYHHCWQISGLPQPAGAGVAQISYKGTCSGQCASSYGAAQ